MAFSEIYVDPSIAGDSGSGTVGDPYGDLEYAIEQETFDTTNGTRVNIKAGTDEILAADLSTALADTSVSIAWAPGITSPLIFQGYTSAAGDGGVGGISGGGSVGILNNAAYDYTSFIDLHLHNCGAATVVDIDNWCNFIRLEVDNTSGAGLSSDTEGQILDCYIHNVGGIGATVNSGIIARNHLENGTNKFSIAINCAAATMIHRNIVSVDGASDGINIGGTGVVVQNNSDRS